MSDILAAAREDARNSGLRYLGDDHPGIGRQSFRGRFRYRDADGKVVRDKATLDRIRHLAIPPAWSGVWISPVANGHIQATGRDQRGRKQYRYHADFRAARDRTKFEHTLEFGKHIEKIREGVAADMARQGLPREKVLATIVHLLDTTLIRVGNDEYARANGSFGLTTLRNKHVEVDGGALHFEFKGKSGKMWRLDVHDRRVARIVRSLQELPGQHLFQYLDDSGDRQSVGSADVNAYLAAITGADITAKDFRTFAGTVLAASALARFKPVESAAEAKVNVRAAIEEVAERLGNTPAICRKCYVHPEIVTAYLDGALAYRAGKSEERAVLRFLKSRLGKRPRRRAAQAVVAATALAA
jgi:DNA topoisomerase-1